MPQQWAKHQMQQEVTMPLDNFLKTRLHNFLIKPKSESWGICQGAHVELATVFFCKSHALNSKLVQFLYLGAERQNVKGRVGSILVELEQLREKAV